jgi:hypothetical protein
MAVPNHFQFVVETANKYPREFREAHTNGPNTELWIRLLAYEMHTKLDPRWGLNGKRGTTVLSQDAINWKGEGIGFDPSDGDRRITVVDVIGAAGGPDPRPAWQVLNDPTVESHRAAGRWIQPLPVPGYHDGQQGPPVVVTPPPVDTTLVNAVQAVEQQLKAVLASQERLARSLELLNNKVQQLDDHTCQNSDDFVAALVDNVDQQEASNAALKASVDGLNERFDRGFTVQGKAGWPVGNIKANISLKELD